MTLFVTRPAPDAERTVRLLREARIEAEPAPLMEIRQLDVPLPELAENEVLAFTSANGVRAWVQAGGSARPVFAVGDATASAAAELGLPVEGIAGGDVDALYTLLKAQAADRPILHVRGRDSLGALADRLKTAGHDARALELYEARALPSLPGALTRALQEGGHQIGVFSPRTMRLFLSLVRDAGLADRLSQISAICLSQAVAEAGADADFQSLHVADRPELSGFVDSARLRRT